MIQRGYHRRRLTGAEREAVHRKTDGRCAYCGCELELKDMQVDHKIPMNRYEVYAGEGIDLNGFDNLFPACRSCNHYKSTMDIETFRAMLEREPEILARDSVAYRNAVRFGLVKPTQKKVLFYFEKIERNKELTGKGAVDF